MQFAEEFGSNGLTLKPHETAIFILNVNIPEETPLGGFSFSLAVTCDQARIIIPVKISIVSELILDFTILVEDEFSYFADGRPKVANASVRIVNYARGIDTKFITDDTVRK